jgi:ATP-dependent DNA helicase PIF1
MEILLVIGIIIVIIWVIAVKSGSNGNAKVTYTDATGTQRSENLQRRRSRNVSVIERPDNFIMTAENERILSLMESASQNIFLTGKAGTGKSTLLRYFRSTTHKNHAVVAPTGIAAINVQGQTIHSFFGFKVGVTVGTVRFASADRLKVLRALDTLIIDEISMVRADLLDCIDRSLRMNRRNDRPFGGVQVIAIGDPYQLPPVVTSSEQKFILNTYGAPHFFKAHSYKAGNFKTEELNKVHRQSDPEFIGILNAVRTGNHSSEHIALLQKLTENNIPSEKSIHLVTTNQMAQVINKSQLETLSGRSATYTAKSEGNFSEKSAPTEVELTLKEGAKVMLLNNDKEGRWVNGDVGTIIGLGTSSVRLKFEDGTFDDVENHSWENIRFEYDEETHKIEPVVIGRFVQLPIKLAWAITIHKSQGMSYDYLHVDFGSGTFAPGQAYVALSRARTPQGLSFEAPMLAQDVIVDQYVKIFMGGASTPAAPTTLPTRQVQTPSTPPASRQPVQQNFKPTQANVNQLKFFIQNPNGYTSGSAKAREKVKIAQLTFHSVKDQLSGEQVAAYESAIRLYKSKVIS